MLLLIPLTLGLLLATLIWRQRLRGRRAAFIDDYRFPPNIVHKVRDRYPHLDDGQLELVMEGLRHYLHLCHGAGRRMVAMPSQAVDLAWHEFILYTRNYQHFCRRALGRFLHHTPAEAMQSPTSAQDGIKTAWRLACHREGLDPKAPSRLPLLFALDAELAIEDGFHYQLDCRRHPGGGYCASHIGCGGDGGSSCGGDSGCGGGCGGD
ncbi:hypothetical protein [Gallaecimonas sp. GXIMD4217]|uniref:glycine-rich domain-containing protein n=1 Tax=Gallaecimonas sp. GXIMD4217 TaxID=3131927 RepID=UPI00311ABADA